jgi:nitronate monooxygenase
MDNANVERLLEIEWKKGADLKIDDIIDRVAGVYPKIMIDGDMDAGAWSCGLVVGLINDIPPVANLIDRIMTDAKRMIGGRLAGMLKMETQAA